MKTRSIAITTIFAALFLTANAQAQSDQEINKVLEQKRAFNKNTPYTEGFKIQLYNGNESKAYQIRNNYQSVFNEKATVIYESPEWKVRVGNYKTRLEADRALMKINEEFSGAIILATRVKL